MNPTTPRSLHLNALAGAALLMAAAIAATSNVTAEPAATGSCAAYDDDWGWGGSYVECDLSCERHAGLLVAGAAGDPDAGVAALYKCGGQAASCISPTPICAGTAPGLTSKREDGAKCSAESDEWWSSQILVACATLAVLPNEEQDPIDIVCRTFPQFPECGGTDLGVIQTICSTQFLGLNIEAETVALLFPASFAGHQLSSMVSAARLADGRLVGFHFDAVDKRCHVFHS